VGQFVTGGEADVTAPGISALAVTPSGPCVLVSFQTDEPAAGTLLVRGSALAERTISAGAGTTAFSVAASLAAFSAGSDVEIVARAIDLAGNIAETAAVSLTAPPELLPIAITEVQANSTGLEPAQEYVELRNLGAQSVDLGGIAIEDSKGSDLLPAFSLEPGAYALVVSSGFDPASPVDTPPRPGTALLRVDTRIGADGLANGGEVVRLRSAAGTVLSTYGGGVDVSAAKWSGKSVHRVPQEACDQPASWTQVPLPATPGWGAP
jgi:Lamin Tail Domain